MHYILYTCNCKCFLYIYFTKNTRSYKNIKNVTCTTISSNKRGQVIKKNVANTKNNSG